jgi:hypothetical protein
MDELRAPHRSDSIVDMDVTASFDLLPHSYFRSRLPYDPERIHAAAIYCSDGRFGQQCDDFLHNALKLPKYDRLVIPGGPACLAGHFAACRQADVIMEHIDFLVRVHELNRINLIAHQNCAFYLQQLGIDSKRLEEQQREDLAAAAARIRGAHCSIAVHGYFARLDAGCIGFEAVALPTGAARAL